MLSCRAVDGHQMYFGGSVVGKASTVGIAISPTAHPFPNFHRVSKRAKLASFETSLNFKPPCLKMQQDIRILKQECNECCDDRPMSRPIKFGEVWVHAPMRKLCQL